MESGFEECRNCGGHYDPIVFSRKCPHAMRNPFIFDNVLPIYNVSLPVAPEEKLIH